MPTSALLPMGGAVSGVAGPNWILVGDAAGCVNPLNGEGIDYGLETGRVGAELMRTHTDLEAAWPALLTTHYGEAFSIARRLAGLITVPRLLPTAAPSGCGAPPHDVRPSRHGQPRHRRRSRLHGASVALGRTPVRTPRRSPAVHLLAVHRSSRPAAANLSPMTEPPRASRRTPATSRLRPPPPGSASHPRVRPSMFPPPPGYYGPPRFEIGNAFTWAWAKFKANRPHCSPPARCCSSAAIVIYAVAIAAVFAVVPDPRITMTDPQTGELEGVGSYFATLGVGEGAFPAPIPFAVVWAGLIRTGLRIADGERPGIRSLFSYRNAPDHADRLIMSTVTLIGIILCYVPGLAFGLFAGFTPLLRDRPRQGPVAAIKSSFAVVKANFGNALVAMLLAGLVAVRRFDRLLLRRHLHRAVGHAGARLHVPVPQRRHRRTLTAGMRKARPEPGLSSFRSSRSRRSRRRVVLLVEIRHLLARLLEGAGTKDRQTQSCGMNRPIPTNPVRRRLAARRRRRERAKDDQEEFRDRRQRARRGSTERLREDSPWRTP